MVPKPRQIPDTPYSRLKKEETVERGHKVNLYFFPRSVIKWEVSSLDNRILATFSNEDDARMFFNMKNGGL